MNRLLAVLYSLFVSAALLSAQSAPHENSGSTSEAAQKIPVMDGEAGPCSLELTVMGPNGKPIYAAKIKVHITYGFGGFRRLDLEAGTNSDGKLKFTGLPARVHRPPLEFSGSKDDLQGVATYDPSSDCQGKHDLSLNKSKPDEQH